MGPGLVIGVLLVTVVLIIAIAAFVVIALLSDSPRTDHSAVPLPASGAVVDDAGLLFAGEHSRVEELVSEEDAADGTVRVGVVTRWDTGGEPDDLATKTAEAWTRARPGAPYVVIVVDMKDREIRVGAAGDARRRISWDEVADVKSAMRPDLKAGRYEAGLEAGARAAHEKARDTGPSSFLFLLGAIVAAVVGFMAVCLAAPVLLSPARFRARREARAFQRSPEGVALFGPGGMPRWALKDYRRYRYTFRRPPSDEPARQNERWAAWHQGRPPHPDTDFLRYTQYVPDVRSWLHWYRQDPDLYSTAFRFPPGADDYSFGRKRSSTGSGYFSAGGSGGSGGGSDF